MTPSLIFFDRGEQFVTPVRVHRKYHISMYFLRKVISHFLPNEKISCFRGKNTIFPDNTRKILINWKDHLFRKVEENNIFPCIFLRKIIFLLRCKIMFSGKRNIIFPDNYSSAIFLERPSFQDVWKKKMCFSVQWKILDWNSILILFNYTGNEKKNSSPR